MRTLTLGIFSVCLVAVAAPVLAQPTSEIDILRAEIARMRADYESRIDLLEQRIDELDRPLDPPT